MNQTRFHKDSENEIRPDSAAHFLPDKMNHELRAAIHSLLGYLEIFSEQTSTDLKPDQAKLLSRIDYHSHHIAEIILALLGDKRKDNANPPHSLH
ncbi:MAG: hypothetical protein GXO75_15810 [Calditrichaeota bacterium]|nr:hypothetical protein [Calditrichota bacterium]